MEISKIKIPGRLDPIDIKDALAREDLLDVVDFISDKEYAVAQMLADVNDSVKNVKTALSEVEHVTALSITDLNATTSSVSNSLSTVQSSITDIEKSVAASLTTLNESIKELYQIVEDLINFVSEKEQGAAAAIADLNNRINNISE